MVNKKVRALIARQTQDSKAVWYGSGAMGARCSGLKTRSPATIGVIPMIAPNVPRPIAVSGWREKHARRIVTSLPPILSSTQKQYDNRRAAYGFCLAGRYAAPPRNGRTSQQIGIELSNRMAVETKEQL
jgi:hypothetical protein